MKAKQTLKRCTEVHVYFGMRGLFWIEVWRLNHPSAWCCITTLDAPQSQDISPVQLNFNFSILMLDMRIGNVRMPTKNKSGMIDWTTLLTTEAHYSSSAPRSGSCWWTRVVVEESSWREDSFRQLLRSWRCRHTVERVINLPVLF